MKLTNRTFLAIILVFFTLTAFSQPASPAETATGSINGANMSVKYSSPSVKGRQIWGTLVPYGKVWRAGANKATIFETDKNITFEGKPLKAGKYSLYAIPGETEWTIIVNSQTGQWGITMNGETTENPSKDVFRVNVKPRKSQTMNEQLTYKFDKSGLILSWEYIDIPISIK